MSKTRRGCSSFFCAGCLEAHPEGTLYVRLTGHPVCYGASTGTTNERYYVDPNPRHPSDPQILTAKPTDAHDLTYRRLVANGRLRGPFTTLAEAKKEVRNG